MVWKFVVVTVAPALKVNAPVNTKGFTVTGEVKVEEEEPGGVGGKA
jgi:hypothetical protein